VLHIPKQKLSARDYIGVPYGEQKFYSGSVVKIAGKITFEVYICPETVMS